MVCLVAYNPRYQPTYRALQSVYRMLSVGAMPVAIAFGGVLIILRPGTGVFQWVSVLPLIMAVAYAFNQIIARKIGHEEHPVTSLAYTTIVGAVLMTIAVPFDWVTPDLLGWVMLIAVGGFAGGAHFFIIRAYERSAVAVVAPFIYTELLWATLVGVLVFSDVPDLSTIIGATVVAASSLFVLLRQGRA